MISGEWGKECGGATAGGSATKLGLSLGDWDWRAGGRVEMAYLVPGIAGIAGRLPGSASLSWQLKQRLNCDSLSCFYLLQQN